MPFYSQQKIKKGDYIFRQNQEADCAYIIETGTVSIIIEQPIEKILVQIGPGEIFGEMAIIDGGFRSASARAEEDCLLTPVSTLQVQDRVSTADPIVRLLLMLLLKRVRSNNAGARLDSKLTQNSTDAQIQSTQMEVIEKIKFEKDLILALQENQFVLHYQPIIDLKTRTAVGLEALIRWQSPERGLVPPLKFLNIAEETSLMIPIGKWVIEQASRDLQTLQKKFGKELSMSVNVSVQQFQNAQFIEDLEAAVRAAQIHRKQLHLEITEGVMMSGGNSTHSMQKLNELEYQTSLDDFGTGYSSLSYLTDWKFNYLKIDQSFVRKMSQDPKSFLLCKTISSLAKDMQLEVIAEGIETADQADQLTALGCQFGQGYFFSRPEPIAKIEKYLELSN